MRSILLIVAFGLFVPAVADACPRQQFVQFQSQAIIAQPFATQAIIAPQFIAVPQYAPAVQQIVVPQAVVVQQHHQQAIVRQQIIQRQRVIVPRPQVIRQRSVTIIR